MNPSAVVILGALLFVIVLIALAWFLVLRRFDEGNFEAGGSFHPPFTEAHHGEQAPERAWTAERQLEREGHAARDKGLGQAKDRNAARGWGG